MKRVRWLVLLIVVFIALLMFTHYGLRDAHIGAAARSRTDADITDRVAAQTPGVGGVAANPSREPAGTSVNNAVSRSAGVNDGKGLWLDICDLGWTRVRDFFSLPFVEINSRYLPLQKASRKLAASEKEIERATGLYFQAVMAGWEAKERFMIDRPQCADRRGGEGEYTRDCYRVYGVAAEARSRAAGPLIELALTTRDANVYAMAFNTCTLARIDACKSITAAAWAKLDPDNMMPLLAAAASLSDEPARAAALYREAATKREFNNRPAPLDRLLMSEAIRAEAISAQTQVATMFIGERAATEIGGQWVSTMKYCKGSSEDSERRETCDRIATTISGNAAGLMELGMATAIGKIAGWEQARLEAHKREYDLIANFMIGNSLNDQALSCESQAKQVQFVIDSYQTSELATVRKQIAAAGFTAAQIEKSAASRWSKIIGID